MTEAADPTALVRRVAATGLPGEWGGSSFQVEDGAWRAFASSLVWEKLTGLALAAWDGGVLQASVGQAKELVKHQRRAMLHALTLERRLLSLAEAFEEAGVEFVVLKGPALAHTFYPDPSWRPFGDLDLLVRTRDWQRTCALLPEQGFRRKYPEPRPGFVERFGHTAVHRSDDGFEVDLHRTLVAGPFGLWVNLDELFEHTTWFHVGGRRLRRLDDAALLVNACLHASLGSRPPLLLPLRDVAQVAMRGEIDWDLLADWGRRWKLRAVYRHAFQAVSETLGARLPREAHALTGGEPGTRRERRALEAYVTDRRWRGGKALGSLHAIRGLRAKTAYARMLFFPSKEFLEFRSEGRSRSYARRWLIPVRWIRKSRCGPGR